MVRSFDAFMDPKTYFVFTESHHQTQSSTSSLQYIFTFLYHRKYRSKAPRSTLSRHFMDVSGYLQASYLTSVERAQSSICTRWIGLRGDLNLWWLKNTLHSLESNRLLPGRSSLLCLNELLLFVRLAWTMRRVTCG